MVAQQKEIMIARSFLNEKAAESIKGNQLDFSIKLDEH
jgi:hypothetical protein